MADQSFRSHLKLLAASNDLLHFEKEVDPDANISALSYRAFAERGKACLFTNVKGHSGWRVATQIVADRRKWGLALGVPEEAVVATMSERIANPIAPEMSTDANAPVQQVVQIGNEVDLTQLPAIYTSERDPARYIAAGMCIIKDPETGVRNMSVHRAQVLGPNETGYLICPRQALKIYQMYEKHGRPMEVAMVIGGHPAIMFAAGYVAPYGQDELAVAGGLLGEPVRLVKCVSVDIEVPAEAEIVIEGEILPNDRTPEGPFGEVTGTYAQEGSTPRFRVKAITRRRDAIFYGMMCGLPPSDTHSIVAQTIEMKLWEHLQRVDGGRLDLIDVRCFGTVTPMMVVLKLRPRYAGQAKTALLAALASPYLHPKFAIAVDDDIDIRDVDQVMWAVAARVHAAEDVLRWNRTRVFQLDNASPIEPGMSAMYRVGTKLAIDATRPPESQAAARAALARALPPNVDRINLADFLPATS